MATNHLMGYGWWGWLIQLKAAIAVSDWSTISVFSSYLPTEPGERLKSHLHDPSHGQKGAFATQNVSRKDVHARSNLAYYSAQSMGDGWALVGDAAGFLDPLYSQGFDFISYTCYATFEI